MSEEVHGLKFILKAKETELRAATADVQSIVSLVSTISDRIVKDELVEPEANVLAVPAMPPSPV